MHHNGTSEWHIFSMSLYHVTWFSWISSCLVRFSMDLHDFICNMLTWGGSAPTDHTPISWHAAYLIINDSNIAGEIIYIYIYICICWHMVADPRTYYHVGRRSANLVINGCLISIDLKWLECGTLLQSIYHDFSSLVVNVKFGLGSLKKQPTELALTWECVWMWMQELARVCVENNKPCSQIPKYPDGNVPH